ncbi:MAG: hypothetical protein ABR567_04105 [Myxococcales bacterium]|nr:hypothetical protein [Myxococcales bacterium]
MILLALLVAADAAALQAALKSVKSDGKVKLSEAAQDEVVSLLPPARKGEECAEKARVAAESDALKDRGDGAILVAEVTTCKGGRVFALSTGQPPRAARLLDSQSDEVRSVKALSLGGGKRENGLAVELLTSPATSELMLFLHGDSGFSFSHAGTLKDFNALRECATGGEDSAGWSSWVKTEQDHLAVLRVDATCSGGAWQASCLLYRFDQGNLARSGTCNLPPRLDAKALKASGWK